MVIAKGVAKGYLHRGTIHIQAKNFHGNVSAVARQRRANAGVVTEGQVPTDLIARDLYKSAGYQCRECAFVSKKRGFSGKQALRAHIKKHKNDRRAWARPLVRQLLIVTLLMTAAIAGWLDIPVVSVPADIAKWITAGTAIAPLLFAFLALIYIEEGWNRTLANVLSFLVVTGTLGGLYAAALAWKLVEPAPPWPYQVPLWAMVLGHPGLGRNGGPSEAPCAT